MSGTSRRLPTRLWIAFALFTLYAATIPFEFVQTRAEVRERFAAAIERSAFAQFATISKSDALQNLLLFVPFGVFGVASLGRTRRLTAIASTIGLAALLSAACELLQLLTVDRVSSLWDVWANSAGALVGAVGYLASARVARQVEARARLEAFQEPIVLPLLSMAALIAIAAWEPFDVTLDVGTVWAKVKPFTAGDAFAWKTVTDELLTALRFATLAALMVQWRRLEGTKASARLAGAVIGGFLAVALESSQFFITSRAPSLQDLLAAVLGVLVGVSTGPWLTRINGAWLITITSVVAATPFYLQPFEIAPAHRPFALFPFLSYYEFTSLQTLSHVIDLMLVYAPIGFAIAWVNPAAHPRRTLTSVALVVTGLAASFEYAQGWVIGRFPDITDVGVAILGGVAGAALAQRGRTISNPAHHEPLTTRRRTYRSQV